MCVIISVRPAGRFYVCDKNVDVTIFSDVINMIIVKLCMMVVLFKLYPFIATFSDLECISRSQQCQTVLTEKFMFVSD